MESLRNRTEPSAKAKWQPPGWKLEAATRYEVGGRSSEPNGRVKSRQRALGFIGNWVVKEVRIDAAIQLQRSCRGGPIRPWACSPRSMVALVPSVMSANRTRLCR